MAHAFAATVAVPSKSGQNFEQMAEKFELTFRRRPLKVGSKHKFMRLEGGGAGNRRPLKVGSKPSRIRCLVSAV